MYLWYDMSMKIASKSFHQEGYPCKYNWPEDCYVQCGGNGIVLQDTEIMDVLENQDKAIDICSGMLANTPIEQKHYRTAFFEAFPKNPNTFLRGEGTTIELAEEQAWQEYQKILQCANHEFEKRNYKNGAGICKNCGLFKSKVFEPTESCYLCNTKTFYGRTNTGEYYCKDCNDKVPKNLWSDLRLSIDSWREEDFEVGD